MSSNGQRDDGFFSSLFDLSFSTFITTKIIKILYVLAMIAIGLYAIFFIIAGFSNSVGAGILALIGAAVFALFMLIYARVFLELIIVVFRIGENTATMARALGGQGSAPWASPDQPAQPYRTPEPTAPPSPEPSPGWEPPPFPTAGSEDPTRRLPEDRGDQEPRRGPGDVPPPPPT